MTANKRLGDEGKPLQPKRPGYGDEGRPLKKGGKGTGDEGMPMKGKKMPPRHKHMMPKKGR